MATRKSDQSYPISNEPEVEGKSKIKLEQASGRLSCINGSNRFCSLKVSMPKLLIITFFNSLSIHVLTIPFMESIKVNFLQNSFIYLMVITSMRNLLHLIGSLVFGQLSDKIGRRNILLMSIAQQAIMAAMFATNLLNVFFVLYAILGFFSVIDTITLSYVIEISDEKTLKRNTALVTAIVPLAMILGVLFGYAIKTASNCTIRFWRTAILHSLLVLITFFIAFFTIGETKGENDQQGGNKSGENATSSGFLQLCKDLREVLKPEVTKSLLIVFLVSLGCEGFLHSILMYSRSVMQFDVKEETILLALMPIYSALLTLTVPVYLPGFIGTRGTLAISTALLFVAINVMGIFPNKKLFFVMALPISLYSPIRILLFTNTSQQVAREHAGVFTGFFNLVIHLSVIFSSLITALLFKFQGIDKATSTRTDECNHKYIQHLKELTKKIGSQQDKGLTVGYFKGEAFMGMTLFVFVAFFLVFRLKNSGKKLSEAKSVEKIVVCDNGSDEEVWKNTLGA